MNISNRRRCSQPHSRVSTALSVLLLVLVAIGSVGCDRNEESDDESQATAEAEQQVAEEESDSDDNAEEKAADAEATEEVQLITNPSGERGTILMVLTNHGELGDTGESTGFYLSEVTHPYKVLTEAGYAVEFASPKGGKAPMDGVDREDPINAAFLDNEELVARTENTTPLGDVDPSAYKAIFFAGGHGTMWDLPDDENVQKVTASIYEQGGVVAAVCHGPAGLLNVKLENGDYLVDGKEVTGFTNEEEREVGHEETVPFLLETQLKERGATFKESEPFRSRIVVSNRVVTGQNPASAAGTARAVLLVLNVAEHQQGQGH